MGFMRMKEEYITIFQLRKIKNEHLGPFLSTNIDSKA